MTENESGIGDTGSQPEFDGGPREIDRMLQALADERRRHVCYHVIENDSTDISACAEAVASLETEQPPSEIPEDALEEYKTLLHHLDLPKLSDLGLIEYDERSDAIRCRHSSRDFERLLVVVRAMETE